MRYASDKGCRENQNTHYLFKINKYIYIYMYIFFENHAVYEIIWKNDTESHRPQMKIWGMRIAGWIRRATNTYSEYVLLTAFPLQYLLHECASMLRYTCTACLVTESAQHKISRKAVHRFSGRDIRKSETDNCIVTSFFITNQNISK